MYGLCTKQKKRVFSSQSFVGRGVLQQPEPNRKTGLRTRTPTGVVTRPPRLWSPRSTVRNSAVRPNNYFFNVLFSTNNPCKHCMNVRVNTTREGTLTSHVHWEQGGHGRNHRDWQGGGHDFQDFLSRRTHNLSAHGATVITVHPDKQRFDCDSMKMTYSYCRMHTGGRMHSTSAARLHSCCRLHSCRRMHSGCRLHSCRRMHSG